VAKETNDVIQKLVTKYPEAKVTVTGHSLGAALSTISAIETNKKSPKLAT
jgi:putative lipase involved disintegration of autophagic bodies